jgi:hypothetical protein
MRRIAAVIVFVCLLIPSEFLITQTPAKMSYQGMLTGIGGEAIEDGMYNIHFKLYGQPDPSSPIWSETQSVTIVNGIFNVILGTASPLDLPFDEQYYLGIAIGDGEELSPRIALTTSAYSFRAKSVDDGQVVKSINELRDAVLLEAGENISIIEDENKIVISATSNGGPGNITQVTAGEGLTGGGSEGNVTLSVQNQGITTEKLANESVTSSKLSGGAVIGNKIADNQLVRSINDLTDAVYLSAEGGATVTARGDTLVINAGSGGDGTGVQGIQNTNNTLDIVNPSGPTTTINVKAGGIGTQHIADGSITSQKLASDVLSDGGWIINGDDMRSGVSGFVGVGRADRITFAEVFGIRAHSAENTWGGMYVETLPSTGRPFYGYATNGSDVAWHEFNSNDNQWQLHVGNVARLVVHRNSGNVGIGTSDPSARLHVGGGNLRVTNNFPALILDGTNLNKSISFRKNDQEQGVIFYGDNTGLKAYVNNDANNNTWVLANNGRFGLGVNSPAEKLDVAGAIRLATTTNTNAGTIRWTGTDFEGRKGNEWVSLTAQGTSVWNQSDNTINYLAGNVGIGTNTPAYLVHLRSTSPSLMIENSGTTAAFLRFRRSGDGANDNYIAIGNSGQMILRVGGTDRITVQNGGNVGIGTGSPNNRLQVAGDVQVSGKVKRSATGDNNMVPICYGHISSTGSISNGSGNFTASRTGTGVYQVSISGENFGFSNYTVAVSAIGSGFAVATWSSSGGNLIIYVHNNLGIRINSNLSFVVYKP